MIFNKIKKERYIEHDMIVTGTVPVGVRVVRVCMYRCGRHACVMLFHWYITRTRTRTLGSRLLKRYTFNY